MKLSTYRNLTGATRIDIKYNTIADKVVDSIHCVLGISSEYLNEFMNSKTLANDGEELGDILWYISEYCNIWGIELQEYPPSKNMERDRLDVNLIPETIGKLCDIDKALLAYHRHALMEVRTQLIQYLYDTICMIIEGIGLEISNVMSTNIKKLKLRYPDNFTEHAANNRDLQKELKLLEANFGK